MASQLASLLSHTGFRVVSAFGHVEQLLSVGCAGAPGHRAHSPPSLGTTRQDVAGVSSTLSVVWAKKVA